MQKSNKYSLFVLCIEISNSLQYHAFSVKHMFFLLLVTSAVVMGKNIQKRRIY